jgi:hypothetical protein
MAPALSIPRQPTIEPNRDLSRLPPYRLGSPHLTKGFEMTANTHTAKYVDDVELRLFIEELACNICRFMHTSQNGVESQPVRIRQEVQLDAPNAFADIVVHTSDRASYIVEVDYGYFLERSR